MRLIVAAGQANNAPHAKRLIEGFRAEYVIADRGYYSQRGIEKVEEIGAKAVIPPKSNSKVKRYYDEKYARSRPSSTMFRFMPLISTSEVAQEQLKSGGEAAEEVQVGG